MRYRDNLRGGQSSTPIRGQCSRPFDKAFGSDEVGGFVERHDDGPEIAGGGPGLVAPPQGLHVITLAGRPQARDLAASASAAQRIALARSYHLDTTARPRVSSDPLAHGIGAGHRAHLPRHGLPHLGQPPKRRPTPCRRPSAPVPEVLTAWMRPFRGYFTTAVWRHALVLVAGALL